MPTDATYTSRRGEIETYFDRTAAQAWERLTSTAPVGRIRATVRAGRDRMRSTLLGWLPPDLQGMRLLDAGCGTGALAVEAARRGADVLAIDLSATLVGIARERIPADLGAGSIDFRSGDMLDPALGRFDYVIGMDSLIHYQPGDAVKVLAGLAPRTAKGMLITFAPLTPPLAVMLAMGKLLPRGDRSPAIVPLVPSRLHQRIAAEIALAGWSPARTERIKSGFYTSQALEIVRS